MEECQPKEAAGGERDPRSSTRKNRRRGQPGRLVLYPVLLASVLLGFVRSPYPKYIIISELNRYLAKEHGIQLSVRDILFNPATGRVDITEIYGSSRDCKLSAHLPQASCHVSLLALLKGDVEISDIEVDRPWLRLVHPSPVLDTFKSKGGKTVVHVSGLAVRNGKLTFHKSDIPLDFRTGEFNLGLEWDRQGELRSVSLGLREGELFKPPRKLPLRSLDVFGTISKDSFEIGAMELISPLGKLKGHGRISLDGKSAEAHATGQIRLEGLREANSSFPLELKGQLLFKAGLTAGNGQIQKIDGQLDGAGISINQIRVRDFVTHLKSDGDRVLAQPVELELEGGGVVKGKAEFFPHPGTIQASARIEGLALDLLYRRGLLPHQAGGRLDAEATATIPLAGEPSIEARFLVANPSVLLPNKKDTFSGQNLQGQIALKGKELTFKVGGLSGEGLWVTGEGTVHSDGLLEVPRLHVTAQEGNSLRAFLFKLANMSPRLKQKIASVDFHGPISFIGGFQLKGSFPDVAGSLQAEAPTFPGVPMERATLIFRLSKERFTVADAVIVKEGQRADLSMDLRIDPDTHLDALKVRLAGFPLDSIEKAMDFVDFGFKKLKPSDIVQGTASGFLDLSLESTKTREGVFELVSQDLHRGTGPVLGTLRLEGQMLGDEVSFRKIALTGRATEVSGTGKWDTSTDTIDLKLHSGRFPVEAVPELSRAGIEASARGEIFFSGTMSNPQITGDLTSSQAAVYGEPFGAVRVMGTYQGDKLRFNLRAQYRDNMYNAMGTLTAEDEPRLESTVYLNQVQIEPFLKQFGEAKAPDLKGQLTGEMTISCILGKLETLSLRGHLSEARFSIGEIQAKSAQPFSVQLENRKLSAQGVRFLLNGDPLDLEGSLGVFPLGQLNLFVKGQARLELLKPFLPEGVYPAGVAQIQTSVTGAPSNPSFSGKIQLRDATLRVKDPEFTAEKITGNLELTSRSIKAERLDFRTSYGKGQLTGDCLMEKFKPVRWNLAIQSEKMLVPYPQGCVSEVAGRIRFTGAPGGSLISGDVRVEKSAPARKVDLVELAALLAAMSQKETTPASEAARTTRLNLTIRGDRALQVTGDKLDLAGSVDLQVKGTMDRPAIRGNVIINSGEFKFQMNRFTVDRGVVSFTNPTRIDPELHLQISSDIRDYHVSVQVEGTASRMRTQFTSIPSLPSVEVVRLITTGEIPSVSSRTRADYQTSDTTNILGQVLSQTVEKRLKRVVGVDTFSVNTLGSGSDVAGKARITVGKQISRDLFVTYSRSVSGDSQDLIYVEYRFSPRLTVVATRDEKGYFGVDFRFRRKFR